MRTLDIPGDRLIFTDDCLLKNALTANLYVAAVDAREPIFPPVVATDALLRVLPAGPDHVLHAVRQTHPAMIPMLDRFQETLADRLEHSPYLLLDGHHKSFAYAVAHRPVPSCLLETPDDLAGLPQLYAAKGVETIPENFTVGATPAQLGAGIALQLLRRTGQRLLDEGHAPFTVEDEIRSLVERVRGLPETDAVMRKLQAYQREPPQAF